MERNKLSDLLQTDKENLLNIYVTAGYPAINDTSNIILNAMNSGVDMMEIGIPYSDPIADGPVIQQSSQKALDNGMTLELLFEQLNEIKHKVKIPLLLMGYYNSILKYGPEEFCKKCQKVGISGLIIPDLPLEVFLSDYKELFSKYQLHNILLICPQTSDDRIKKIDNSSTAFVYAVSSASTTGSKNGITDSSAFLEKLNQMKLKHSILTGFNINNRDAYLQACKYTRGAIIGSAFIKAISKNVNLADSIQKFVSSVVHD